MRTVNVGELKNQLSAYLQHVRNGEEILVNDRHVPVARILPVEARSPSDAESHLVRTGAMKLPVGAIDWDLFFAQDTGNVPKKKAVRAAVESRGDR